MDHATCHVVYVDNRANNDLDGKYVHKSRLRPQDAAKASRQGSWEDRNSEYFELILGQIEDVRNNIKNILSVYNGVHICTSGTTCMAKLAELESISTYLQPTLVILETPAEPEDNDEKTQNFVTSTKVEPEVRRPRRLNEPNNSDSLKLLQQIRAEISSSKFSKLIVPITMISNLESAIVGGHPQHLSSGVAHRASGSVTFNPKELYDVKASLNPRQMLRYLDAGAVDVVASPLLQDRVCNLTAHAYRAYKEACKDRAESLAVNRLRKRSWVGFEDKKPYAYLREDMVSGLMTGICNPDYTLHSFDARILPDLHHSRASEMAKAIGSWGFSAHEYSEDELVHAAFLMLQHALSMPQLDNWRLPADDLKIFLMASRAAYNSFVYYHNFRHVVDVLQATFFFLVQLGTLPPYPSSSTTRDISKRSPIAALLRPFDALTLLISAIGHDVGHPGVNNAFLVALNAPLAQLYNDKSVLEAFHCAAYSQILRRYWKHAFEDISMRSLLINSILATDMGVHFKYMTDLKNLQDKVHHNKGIEGWSPQTLDEYRTLTCGLLIKCADISNVARPFDVAAKWSDILQLEFANQGDMEKNVGIPTTLFGGPPELGNLIKLANSQIGFIDIFACPLFEAVTDILPAMEFAVVEMKENQNLWKAKIDQERAKEAPQTSTKHLSKGHISPRSGSPNCATSQPLLSHPEGLPASQSVSRVPTLSTFSQDLDQTRDSRRGSAGSIPRLLGVLESSSPTASPDISRRSSLGLPSGYHSPPHDGTSFSRRSSGAFPGANIQNSNISTRRSSNTMPSQLHLGPGSQSASSAPATENTQPYGRGSEDTLSKPNSIRRVNPVTDLNLGDHSALKFDGGVDTYSGSKDDDVQSSPLKHSFSQRNHQTARIGNNSSSDPVSAKSSHNRSSSGAQTSITQSMPYSPTGTQATSFLTVDSDEKSYGTGSESWNSPIADTASDLNEAERPRSTHRSRNFNGDSGKKPDIQVNVASGSALEHGTRERAIVRRSSRFRLDWWRKKGKTMDSSS